MSKFRKTSQLIIVLVFVFCISGCQGKSLPEQLKTFDQKIGESLNRIEKGQPADSINFFKKETKNLKAKDLTAEQKEKIDQWLEDNALNRYGDAVDAVYAGGTPLFNEATGESLDRYDYILKNHPDLSDELKIE